MNDNLERERVNRLCYTIRGAFFEVFKELGPGLMECIYEEALMLELDDRGLAVKAQAPLTVRYKGRTLRNKLRLDLLVEDTVVVELKSVAELNPVCFKQIITYLRLSGAPVGFLVNFNSPLLEDRKSLFRIVHNF
ncbi:GxxExxY protein [Flaviaesturariibacter amylovorans]